MTDPATANAARYLPDQPFPPYSYVPRQFPHPTRNRAGHGGLSVTERLAPPEPGRWHECRPYLYGIDLFNHGYYWEAQEAWESLWHACGRTGIEADFLRALIRLAAAGVKAREGRLEGVRSHASAARVLLQNVATRVAGAQRHYMGLSLRQLEDYAVLVTEGREIRQIDLGTPVAVVFPFILQPTWVPN